MVLLILPQLKMGQRQKSLMGSERGFGLLMTHLMWLRKSRSKRTGEPVMSFASPYDFLAGVRAVVASELGRGEIYLYESEEVKGDIAVHLVDENLWLTLNQMSELFDRDKSVISRHLRNIFETGELCRKATVAKKATVQKEGSREVERKIEWYNLDAIISVGYRVNSKSGTRFRVWATIILKEHLVQGFTYNERRLAEKGISEAQQVLSLLTGTLEQHNLVTDEGRAILDIVNQYARTWSLLLQYDEDTLIMPASQRQGGVALEVVTARNAIAALKQELTERGEGTAIFGNERSESLAAIIGAIHQTFGGHDLYPSVEEKAAHLLYFIIKDHPFTDGNKRIGTFLFILFLQQNQLLDKNRFDDKALVALTLLIAASDPAQKETLVRLIVNLLAQG